MVCCSTTSSINDNWYIGAQKSVDGKLLSVQIRMMHNCYLRKRCFIFDKCYSLSFHVAQQGVILMNILAFSRITGRHYDIIAGGRVESEITRSTSCETCKLHWFTVMR